MTIPAGPPRRQPAPFHFDASRVGKPILDVPAPRDAQPTPPTVAALAKRMADLAARAQRLSDEIEITNLQHAYGYYVDRKMWDDVADLFATDGTMEMGLQGVYAGRTSIRRGLGRAGLAEGEINDHIHLQTIVTVMPDGAPLAHAAPSIGMTGPLRRRRRPGARVDSVDLRERVREAGRRLEVQGDARLPALHRRCREGMGEGRATRAWTKPRVPSRSASDRDIRDLSPLSHCAAPLRSSGHGPSSAVSGGNEVGHAPSADVRGTDLRLPSRLPPHSRRSSQRPSFRWSGARPITRPRTSPPPTATTSTSSRGTRPRTSSRAMVGRSSPTSAPTSAASGSGSR